MGVLKTNYYTRAMSFTRSFSALFFGLLFGNAIAQSPATMMEKYEGYSAVRLKERTEVVIEVKKDQLEVVKTNFMKTFHPNSNVNGGGEVSLSYELPFSEITDISAHTLVPHSKKDKYKKKKVRDITDKKVIDESVFHNGTRTKSFTFPELKQGSITELEYEKELNEPRLLGREIFSSIDFTENQQLKLTFDEEVEMEILYYNCDSTWFDINRETKGGQKTITWTRKNLEERESHSNEPSFLSLEPHVLYRVSSYHNGDSRVPLLRNLDDLYEWYYDLLKRSMDGLSPELKEITDSLVTHHNDAYDKAKAIYDWVNESIRYVAFEDGLGGYVPRTASAVCEKRYGDCKDMSNIMVAMMKHAGLDAHHVWVGTRSIPYDVEKVPMSLAHNHMIASVVLDDQFYYLDATNKHLPFPYPSEFTQGKDVLVAMGPEKYHHDYIPVLPPRLNRNVDSITIRLEGTDLKGQGKNYVYGYEAMDLAYVFDNITNTRRKSFMNSRYQMGNNSCKSSFIDYTTSDTGAVVAYRFKVPEYTYSNAGKTYLNMNLQSMLTSYKLEEDRETPLKLDRTINLQNHISFSIPEGYVVEFLPESEKQSHDGFSFRCNYSRQNNRVVYDMKINVDKLKIQPEEFDSWNSFISQLTKVYNQSIILKQI